MGDDASKDSVASRTGRKRPDGRDISRYKRLETWSYRRWAWEFLRRNNDFIKACKSIEGGTDEQKMEVAQQFGLKKFKDYREDYRGKHHKPIFAIGTITSVSNLDGDNAIVKQIKIRPSQTLIRFDLKQAVEDEQVLKKQLRLAAQLLNRHLAELKANQAKRSNEHKHSIQSFGIYLRLLDLIASRNTYANCAKLLYPGYDQLPVYKKLDSAELQNRVSRRIKRARDYANHLYRYLACPNTTPNIKGSIPLTISLDSADE